MWLRIQRQLDIMQQSSSDYKLDEPILVVLSIFRINLSMILVLVLVYIILQKDFCLVVHLGVNILTQETANQANTGKSQ